MSSFRYILGAAAIAVIMGGCAANQNEQMQRDIVLERNVAFKNDKISFVDDMDVLVSDIKSVKENGLLKIMVEFMNADMAKKRDFVYQIEWYDQNGMLKESTSWRAAQVIGNQKIKVIEMATIPSVVDYKLIIANKK